MFVVLKLVVNVRDDLEYAVQPKTVRYLSYNKAFMLLIPSNVNVLGHPLFCIHLLGFLN